MYTAAIILGVLSVGQASREASAVREAAAREAEIQRINANEAGLEAEIIREASFREVEDIQIERALIEEQIRDEENRLSAAAIASAAARGIDAFEGSPMIQQGEIIKDSRKQILRTQYAATDAANRARFNAENRIRSLALEANQRRTAAGQIKERGEQQANDIVLSSLMTLGANAYLGSFLGGGGGGAASAGSTSLAIARQRGINTAFQVPGGGF